MAEAAGDVLSLPTSRGRAEAGESRCCIRHPWGTETFYGTAEQVLAYMTKRVAEHETAEAKRPPLGKGDIEWRA